MNIVLYYAPITCSMAPWITLTEAGATFETRALNTRLREHKSAEFGRLNPKLKVPLLVVDGRPLSENVAMHMWAARQFPQAKLLPADPWDEMQALSLLAWCASGIHPFLTRINVPALTCDVAGTEESVRRIAREQLFANFAIADEMLAGRDYFFDHFTAPDAHFFWTFRRGGQLAGDLSHFKHCTAHHERMKARPSVQKLLAFEAETMEQFAKAA